MLDKMTEMVAHMIGIFHITIEEMRMRDVYAEFQALKNADPDMDDMLSISVRLKAPYSLEGFDPSIRYAQLTFDDTPGIRGNSNFTTDIAPLQFIQPLGLQPHMIGQIAPTPFIADGGRFVFELEPPGSVVVVAFQSSWLSDDDLLYLNPNRADFADPAEFLTALTSLHMYGQSLSVLPAAVFPDFSESTLDDALMLHDAIIEIEDTGQSGAIVTILRGEDAFASVENGQNVETLSRLDDVMPALLQDNDKDATPDSEATGADEDSDTTSLADTDPFEGLHSEGFTTEEAQDSPEHVLVTGANVSVNDTSIAVGWLDAPVIAVMGDVVNLNIISQINVLIEHVQLNGQTQESLSQTFNSASMTQTSSIPMPLDEDGAPSTTFPSNWAVTRLEGDLLTVNWVKQFSFATDFDRADIQFSGSETYIAMGNNTIINLVQLAEIGYGYDLIMVGGNMITINEISQTNVMLDVDWVTSTGHAPFDYVGGDNLLFNGASISTVGIDSYSDMQENFAAAGQKFADGADTLDQSVAHDPVFEGSEILRVLYIDGDLTTMNRVEQTNVMGDSDQVHLALDNFAAGTGAPITVTTGSNAAINLASIEVYGVDSQIQTGGQVYSEAFLYQADLIDTDANPLGVQMPALANEAVAFLADDMIDQYGDGADGHVIAATSTESGASTDMMQTMLA